MEKKERRRENISKQRTNQKRFAETSKKITASNARNSIGREIRFLPFVSKTILQIEKCKKICAKEQLMENIQNVILYKRISPQSKNVFELYLLIFLKNIRNLIFYFFFFWNYMMRMHICIRYPKMLYFCFNQSRILLQNLYSNEKYRKFQGYSSSSHLHIIHQE